MYVEYEADGKTIKARVWQKVDTLANWEANTLVIGPGEQAFVVDSGGAPINFKIGDGTKRFSELPWWIDYAGGQYVQVAGNELPEPTVELGYSFVGPGTYTHAGQPDVVAPDGRFSQLVFEGGTWSLKDMGALPIQEGTEVLNPTGEGVPKEKATADYVNLKDREITEKILDLNVEGFSDLTYLPEDRSGFTYSSAQNTTGIYFERINHKGFARFYIKAQAAGELEIYFLTTSGAVATSLYSKKVNVVAGVNSFSATDLGISQSLLNTPTFYLGVRPTTVNGVTRFNTGTTGNLSVVNLTDMTITETKYIGSTWISKEVPREFVLSSYPETKSLAESTARMEPSLETMAIPDNRNNIDMTTAGASSTVYGEKDIYVNSSRKLQYLNIYARANGSAYVYFIEIEGGIATVRHNVTVNCTAGLNRFTPSQLGATTILEAPVKDIYILCGNVADGSPNVIHGSAGHPISRDWYALARSTGVLTISKTGQRFSFWIDALVDNNKIVEKVKELEQAINNSEIGNKKYTGKYGVSFGDSITWYDGKPFLSSHNEAGTIARGYQTYIREYFNCAVENKGQSGWDMPSIVNMITGYTGYANVDFVTITSGANDARKAIPVGSVAPMGTTFNATTYTGALQKGIEHIIAQNPKIKIYLLAPINGWFNESGTTNVPGPLNGEMFISREYINAMIEVGKLYAIPVLNWYDNSFINKLNRPTYIGDKTENPYYLHPNNAGYKLMGDLVCKFLENY